MKHSELKQIVKEEIRKALNESQQVDKELYQLKKQFLPAAGGKGVPVPGTGMAYKTELGARSWIRVPAFLAF